MIATVLEFGEFTLDRSRFELCRGGRAIALERKPLELLLLLVERNGQLVTRTEIAERLWEREVFVDTEHGINTAIRKIRQVLRDDSDEPRFIQTVTGKGYRFIAPIGGLPPQAEAQPAENQQPSPPSAATVLPFPEAPHDRPKAAQLSPPAGSRTLRSALLLAVPVLLLAIGLYYGARYLIHRHQVATANIRSLAVLPLDNLSGDPNQDYFADGMTDELTTMLARDSTLRIVSRTSVMQYKKARRPLREIAQALGVDGIVEGSVARTGSQVHMTLQLIQANTDTHLWADSYNRDADDTALPDEAAQAIAKRLRSAVPVVAAPRYVNPAAHDAYLQGKYLWFSDGGLLESGRHFQKAVEIQPDYAVGWAWLSAYYGASTVGGLLDPRKSLDPMDDAAQRAMQLDPNLAESHWALGAALFFARWDFAAADREILKAISLDPDNAELYHLRAKLLSVLNRPDEAIQSEKKAMELNPFQRPWGLVHTYTSARRYDAAIEDGRLRLKDYPDDTTLRFLMMVAYERKGMYREAVDSCARAMVAAGYPQAAPALRQAFEKDGPRGFVLWMMRTRTNASKTAYVSPVELASYHAYFGEREQTLALLEEGLQQRHPDILWVQTNPAYDFLHTDPRYRALVAKIGLPPAY